MEGTSKSVKPKGIWREKIISIWKYLKRTPLNKQKGACCVIVIIAGNGHCDLCSNPGRG